MPFYDYKCENPACKNEELEEYFEGMNDDVKKTHKCRICGKEQKRQLPTTTMHRFVKKKGLNLSATERKRRWNSQDPREKV